MDGGCGCGESEDHISPDEILYAFTAGAVEVAAHGRRRPAILAKWTKKLRFSPGWVFLSTRRGVFRSYLRTLREFKRRVSGRRFVRVGQSVVANLGEVNSSNLARQRIKTLRYDVEESEFSWSWELVTVSREQLQRVRDHFAMPSYPRLHS